ncbi:unnamed protein product, partial [Effrenium voratum]
AWAYKFLCTSGRLPTATPAAYYLYQYTARHSNVLFFFEHFWHNYTSETVYISEGAIYNLEPMAVEELFANLRHLLETLEQDFRSTVYRRTAEICYKAVTSLASYYGHYIYDAVGPVENQSLLRDYLTRYNIPVNASLVNYEETRSWHLP